jgi:hypothetical protein
MLTTTNEPFFNWVEDTLNDTVATELQTGAVAPVTVAPLQSGLEASWQTVMVPGVPPLSTYNVNVAF